MESLVTVTAMIDAIPLEYRYKAYAVGVKKPSVEMTINGSGIRDTSCFSKREKMHDIVIGLLINKLEFGVDIHAKSQV